MPPGTLVPRDWVLEQVSDRSPSLPTVEPPALPARVDMTIRDLAQLFGKQPSTVRGWVPSAPGEVRRSPFSVAEGQAPGRRIAVRKRPGPGHHAVPNR